jgi:hypothetical protein
MADLASEWGFQPFGTAQSYPGVSSGTGAGKRAQKSDKRRQRQLEEMVSGVVRLAPAGTCGSHMMQRSRVWLSVTPASPQVCVTGCRHWRQHAAPAACRTGARQQGRPGSWHQHSCALSRCQRETRSSRQYSSGKAARQDVSCGTPAWQRQEGSTCSSSCSTSSDAGHRWFDCRACHTAATVCSSTGQSTAGSWQDAPQP